MNIEDQWIDIAATNTYPVINRYVLAWNGYSGLPCVVKWKGTHWVASAINVKKEHITHWKHVIPPEGHKELEPTFKYSFTKRESQDSGNKYR